MSARDTALAALIAYRKQNAWSEGILKEYIARDKLDRRDAALASRLCYGVIQNRLLLDFYIQSFLKGKLKDLQPVVLDILRLGMYQLTMMDKIPVSACVNEAVEQGKRYANHRAAGLVNGLLRAVSRAGQLPQPQDLATKYSHPQKLVELFRESVGDELLQPLLQADNEAPATVVQVNTLRMTPEEACRQLQAQGAAWKRHPYLPDCLYVTGTGSIEALDLFQSGGIYVQDPAAKLAVLAAGLTPGMQVLDCCAAPGGKSFTAAIAMQNQGVIISSDIYEHKIALLEKGASRLGASVIHPVLQSAVELKPQWIGVMDAVLADVPCSGFGVIRKKPDIRYKDLDKTLELPALQAQILFTVCQYVKPGGVLLYSTCTILKRENEQVILAFLQEHPEFSLEQVPVPEGAQMDNEGMLNLYPCIHQTDGFFICKLRKTK